MVSLHAFEMDLISLLTRVDGLYYICVVSFILFYLLFLLEDFLSLLVVKVILFPFS